MPNLILAEMTTSVSELKKHPMGVVAAGEGGAVALQSLLDDAELNAIADARRNQPIIKVILDDL